MTSRCPTAARCRSTPASSCSTTAPTRCCGGCSPSWACETRPTEMSMSISCDECGLNYVGGRRAQRHLRPAPPASLDPHVLADAAARSGASRRPPWRCSTTEPDSTLTYGEFLDRHGFDAALRHPLRAADRLLRVVDGSPGGAGLPRGVPVRVPATTTASWCSATRRPGTPWSAAPQSYVGAITERLDVVRNRHPGDRGQPQARRRRARRRARRPPHLRQGRHRHPRRRRAGPAHRRRRGRDGAARRVRLLDQRGLPAPRRVGAAGDRGAARASWNYRLEGCDDRRRTAARCPTG